MKTFWEKEKERKKMKKKAVSLLMVAAMMTTMAAGCGNKAANNAGSDAAADNSTTSDAAADNSTTSDAAAEETAGTEAAAADSEDEYGVHRKIRTQAGLQKSVMHLMQLIQTGISLSIMVYVQRVMQKQRLHRMLKTPQMYIC